jgi:hypothetical protein
MVEIIAAAFRNRIGARRKRAIQILELFDRTGMTICEGDLQRLREDRLATFKGAGDRKQDTPCERCRSPGATLRVLEAQFRALLPRAGIFSASC